MMFGFLQGGGHWGADTHSSNGLYSECGEFWSFNGFSNGLCMLWNTPSYEAVLTSLLSSLIDLPCTCFPDEVCGIYTKQQHHRRPLSRVCQPERAATPGFYSGPAQLAHRLPHFCCLSSCGWCMQVHIGEHERKSVWWFFFLCFFFYYLAKRLILICSPWASSW